MLGWHFLSDTGRIRAYTNAQGAAQPHGGLPVRAGQTLQVCGLVARGSVASDPTFARGLFASPMPADALFHAPGMRVCRVRLGGRMLRGAHYAQAEERTCLWMADARAAVWEWACWCGERAIANALAAGLPAESCAAGGVNARRRQLRGQADEADVRSWMGRNRQALRLHAGKDARGKWSSTRQPGDVRLIHVYSLCTALCAGYVYHCNGIAARPPGWYDGAEGLIENRKLEALLLQLAPPGERPHGTCAVASD